MVLTRSGIVETQGISGEDMVQCLLVPQKTVCQCKRSDLLKSQRCLEVICDIEMGPGTRLTASEIIVKIITPRAKDRAWESAEASEPR